MSYYDMSVAFYLIVIENHVNLSSTWKQLAEQNYAMMRRHGDCIGNYKLVNVLGSLTDAL